MNDAALQAWIERLRSTSPQRWLLAVLAIAAATIGAIAGELAADGHSTRMVVLIAIAATVAAALPDTHAGLVVIAAVTIRWLVAVDDATTPWSLVTALALLTFHALLALLAVTPPSATIDARLLHRWLRRGGWVAVATAAVWGLATTIHRQQLPGNLPLTVAAFATLTAAVALLLIRTLHDPGPPSRRP